MGQPKYRQMIAQFKPKAGVTPQREPKDDPLVYRYGSQGRQEVNLTKGLLTYVLYIEFSTTDKAVAKLWKALDKMKVFDEWEAHAVFAVRRRDRGKCDYFTIPAPPAKSSS
ncbi:hypothetical protein FPRO06_13127 [Fusarium proliferatum]|nr:hypothetical protein FPRO06_13127 [Fusarium proliferatum]KAI1066140.1 hypothetical protein LB506_008269 [Fusarium annulatum]CVL13346.1 uncharacterized protein FPRN_14790 [Fusarium proliferatum]